MQPWSGIFKDPEIIPVEQSKVVNEKADADNVQPFGNFAVTTMLRVPIVAALVMVNAPLLGFMVKSLGNAAVLLNKAE